MHTILITGANRGIGLELARQALLSGHRVYAACREPAGATDLHRLAASHDDALRIIPLDVTDAAQIADAVATIDRECGHLDGLINNAGILNQGEDLDSVSAAAMEDTFRVNSIAPLLLSRACLPLLSRSDLPVILNVSSQMGSLTRKTSGGSYSYCASKAALNMVSRALAADLRPHGVVVMTAHPGWVQTDMGGPAATLTPAESADGLLNLLEAATMEKSGGFYVWDGSVHPW